jgi:hypothetical protein
MHLWIGKVEKTPEQKENTHFMPDSSSKLVGNKDKKVYI